MSPRTEVRYTPEDRYLWTVYVNGRMIGSAQSEQGARLLLREYEQGLHDRLCRCAGGA